MLLILSQKGMRVGATLIPFTFAFCLFTFAF